MRGLVPRAHKIVVKALDRQGRVVEIEAEDFPARVIQHETDHLDGMLFLDRMQSMASLTFLDEYGAVSREGQRRRDETPACWTRPWPSMDGIAWIWSARLFGCPEGYA